MEPWKTLSVLPPPVITTQIVNEIDVTSLEHVCNNIVTVLSKQSPLHNESALLSRFLYKYDKKFRNDIGYRNIRKTISTLRKYLQLNLLKDVENFISYLPQEDHDYLPSRQMLEYLLVRILSFCKLMLRVYVCSKQASIFYLDRIKRGESHWMSVMPYALLSRIWSMSRVLLQHSSKSWYTGLHCFLSKLQSKGLNFLPDNYKLPENLSEWLDLKNIEQFGKLEWSQKNKVQVSMGLDDEESDTFDRILSHISKMSDEPEENLDVEVNKVISNNLDIKLDTTIPEQVDLGQAVSRETFNILGDFQKKLTQECTTNHYFRKVHDPSSLNEFIKQEDLFRNNNDNQSLTKHLSFMQWQALKNALLKECNELSRKRKIEKKLQKIWKEKCLDYM